MNPGEIKKNLEMLHPEKEKMTEKKKVAVTKEQKEMLLGGFILYGMIFFLNWGLYNWLAKDLGLPKLSVLQFGGATLVIHWFTRLSFRNFTKNG